MGALVPQPVTYGGFAPDAMGGLPAAHVVPVNGPLGLGAARPLQHGASLCWVGAKQHAHMPIAMQPMVPQPMAPTQVGTQVGAHPQPFHGFGASLLDPRVDGQQPMQLG